VWCGCPNGHHAVTEVLVDAPAERADHRVEAHPQPVDHLGDHLGVNARRQRREPLTSANSTVTWRRRSSGRAADSR
jgi:hypothetical protein